jgi:hypothetical protein
MLVGVPEPSAGLLLLLGAMATLSLHWQITKSRWDSPARAPEKIANILEFAYS